jgi:hypothetical protein
MPIIEKREVNWCSVCCRMRSRCFDDDPVCMEQRQRTLTIDEQRVMARGLRRSVTVVSKAKRD